MPPVAKKNWVGPWTLLGPPGLWLVFLLVVPTLVIFELSLVPGIKPGDLVNPSGLDNYTQIFEGFSLEVVGGSLVLKGVYVRVMVRSLLFALGTTAVSLILGFPVAYWIALMSPKRWRNFLLVAFILPLWTSSLLRSYAWISILRPTGVLNSFLGIFNLPALDILNQSPAVLVGMSYSFLPYMVLILYSSLEKLDLQLLEAAADLGATPIQSFWKITVPQSLQGIAAGSLLVFIISLGDFINP
ncbi:MAG: ABC transporter permease, partial [Cyanobacteria bacterium P01_F01_bin.153]